MSLVHLLFARERQLFLQYQILKTHLGEGFMSAYVSAIHTWFSEIGVEMKMLYQSGMEKNDVRI